MKYFNDRSCTDAFEGSYIEYATLHVPKSSVDKYNAVEPWKNFQSIVPIETDDTPTMVSPLFGADVQILDGVVSVSGEQEGMNLAVYNTYGQLVGSGKATSCTTDIRTSLRRGEVAIVKMGSKAMKVVMK